MASKDLEESFEDEKVEKNDMRLVPKTILRNFIETYRGHPALWQIKNREIYNNRNLKNRGYSALIKIWKNYDPEADQKTVRLKIQSLRGSFRKELKKVENSSRSVSGDEDVYRSSLWYFNLMSFLRDHETVTKTPDLENSNTIFVKDLDKESYFCDDEPELNEEIDENLENENNDTGLVPKSIIKQFIETYRSHPALWQVKNKQLYHNKNLKFRGYSALVKVWKNHDPETDQKTVSQKVQSLRASFRKELRKVEKSARSASGDVYVSNLWYYNLMNFLKEQETETKGIGMLENSSAISVKDEDKEMDMCGDVFEINEIENIQAAITSDDSSIPKPKKPKLNEERIRKNFTTNLPEKNSKYDENEALGQYVTSKLCKINNPKQRMYAEALLTKVLNKAILNKLHKFSDIRDNRPSTAYISPSNVPTNIDSTTDAESIQNSD